MHPDSSTSPNATPKRTREAQQWAQQMLEDIRRIVRGKELPFDIPEMIMLKGIATRTKQEVNLAIKKHNIREEIANNDRWLAQIAASKKPGAVIPPDYEMDRILWCLHARAIDTPREDLPGYEQRYILVAALPLGRRRPLGKMELLAQEFSLKIAGTESQESNDNPLLKSPRIDPFERWLSGEPGKPGKDDDGAMEAIA